MKKRHLKTASTKSTWCSKELPSRRQKAEADEGALQGKPKSDWSRKLQGENEKASSRSGSFSENQQDNDRQSDQENHRDANRNNQHGLAV